jgi:hypothetical protein
MSSGVLNLQLDAKQTLAFRDILDDQKIGGAFIFGFVSCSFEPSEGRSTVKLQLKRVRKRTAARLAKLIKEDDDQTKEKLN